ncbi:MAG: bifunctional UDP-sugar hydrolase/5'-nucleotidase [Elusimicrobiota bacterium]
MVSENRVKGKGLRVKVECHSEAKPKNLTPPMSLRGAERRSNLMFVVLLTLFLAGSAFCEVPEKLIILWTNDLHGHIAPEFATFFNPEFPPPMNNFAGISRVIHETKQKAEKENIPVLTLDAGDTFQGTPEGNIPKGKAVWELFNLAGYDLICPGNHDLDYGVQNLIELIQIATMPVICANIIDSKTGKVWEYVEPYVIKQYGDLRVGIIGLITPGMVELVSAPNRAGLEFPPPEKILPDYLKKLREDEKVDIIICVTHLGYEYDQKLAAAVPGIDVIVGGHSHTGLTSPIIDPCNHTIIVQAYANGSCIGRLPLEIDKDVRKIRGIGKYELITVLSDIYESDEKVVPTISSYVAIVSEQMDKPIGTAKRDLNREYNAESALGNLICDAVRQEFSGDISFVNSGGIRQELMAGEVTLRQVYNILPFGNKVISLELHGEQLNRLLEFNISGTGGIFQTSGIKYTYDPEKPTGSKIIKCEAGGQPVDLADTTKKYKVVTIDYLLERGNEGSKILEEGTNRVYTGANLMDIVAEYIRAHSPVDAQIEGRIIKIQR